MIAANAKRSFQGPIPVGDGFIVSAAASTELRNDDSAPYGEVVRPYLVGEDIANDPEQAPSRWIIDFGLMSLEQAMRYPKALAIVRREVKPVRDTNKDAGFRSKWWAFGRPRGELRVAISPLGHYLAVARHSKRMVIAKVAPATMASDATNVFAFDDDSMGILMSRAHDAWAWAQSSTREGRGRGIRSLRTPERTVP